MSDNTDEEFGEIEPIENNSADDEFGEVEPIKDDTNTSEFGTVEPPKQEVATSSVPGLTEAIKAQGSDEAKEGIRIAGLYADGLAGGEGKKYRGRRGNVDEFEYDAENTPGFAPQDDEGKAVHARVMAHEGGTLGHFDRPMRINRNKDGKVNGYSTTSSMIAQDQDGRYAVIPTVVDGQELSTGDAVKRYAETGEHWGKADNEDDARKMAEAVHTKGAELNQKQWNDYLHNHWDDVSDEIRNDWDMRSEHSKRKRDARVAAEGDKAAEMADEGPKMTTRPLGFGMPAQFKKGKKPETVQVAPDLFMTGDVLEDADGRMIKKGGFVTLSRKDKPSLVLSFEGAGKDGKPVFDEVKDVSGIKADLAGGLNIDEDDYKRMLGEGKGKKRMSPLEQVRLGVVAETGDEKKYGKGFMGTARAVIDRMVPYVGRLDKDASAEQLKHLSNIQEGKLDEYAGKTDDEKLGVAAAKAGLDYIRPGESREDYSDRIRAEAEKALKERTAAKIKAGAELGQTEATIGDKIIKGGIESGGYALEFALPGGIFGKAGKALGMGDKAVRAVAALGSAVPVVAAEAVSRYQENTTPEYGWDEQGKFKQTAAPDSKSEAAYKAIGGAVFDTAVEIGLEAATMGMLRLVGKPAGMALGKLTPQAVKDWGARNFNKFMASETGQALRAINRAYQDFTTLTQINSPFGEDLEENVQAFEKVLNLDGKTSEYKGLSQEWKNFKDNQLNWQTQFDIFYGLVAQLAIGSAKSIESGVAHHVSTADARRDVRMALKRSDISDEAIASLTPKQQQVLDHMWRHYSANPNELKAKVKNLGISMRLAADELLSRESSKMAANLRKHGVEPEKFTIQTDEGGNLAFKSMHRFGPDGKSVPMNAMVDNNHGVTIVDQGDGTFYVMNDWRGLDAIPANSFEEAQKKADNEVVRNQWKESENKIAMQRLMELTDPEKGRYRGRKIVPIPTEAALRWNVAQAINNGEDFHGITRADQLFNEDGSLKQPGAGGFHTPDGTVMVILDNVPSPAEMERLLAHEATGHEGVESATGRGKATVEFIQNAQAEGFSRFVEGERQRAIQKFMAAGMDEAAAIAGVDAAMSTDDYKRESMARYAQGRLHQPTWYERKKHEANERRRKAGENVPIDQSDLEVMLAQAEAKGRIGSNELKPINAENGVRYEEGETSDETGNVRDEAAAQPEQGVEQPAEPEAPRPVEGAAQGAEAPREGVVGNETGQATSPVAATPSEMQKPEKAVDNVARGLDEEQRAALADAMDISAQEPMETDTVKKGDFVSFLMQNGKPLRHVWLNPQTLITSDEFNPNIKLDADRKTGIVPGNELSEFQPMMAGTILVRMVRKRDANGNVALDKDGKPQWAFSVVSGRHRAYAAQQANRAIAAYVFTEDELDNEGAAVLDAVANIHDEKGTINDYISFLDKTAPTREQADKIGILRGKGLMAWSIYADATDAVRRATDLGESDEAGLITPAQATTIAQAAPKGAHERNPFIQSVLLRAAKGGMKGKAFTGYAREMTRQMQSGDVNKNLLQGEQMDLFADESFLAMEALTKRRNEYRQRKSNGYSQVASDIRRTLNREGKLELTPEYAKDLGITDKTDRKQLEKAYDLAVERPAYWDPAGDRILDEADVKAMDAEINATADARAKKLAELKAKREAVKSGKPAPTPTDNAGAAKPTANFNSSPVYVIDGNGEIQEGKITDVAKGGKTKVKYGDHEALLPQSKVFTTRELAEKAVADRQRQAEVIKDVKTSEKPSASTPAEKAATTPPKATEAPEAKKSGTTAAPASKAKTPSIKMKDEAAEKKVQKDEDELAALFDTPELSPAYRDRLTLSSVDEPTAKTTIRKWRSERKDFVNRQTGRHAELKADWGKIFSESAKKKSADYSAHYAAANRLDVLFDDAVKMWDEQPRNGSADISAYSKYGCPFAVGNSLYLAKITVKEYADTSMKDGFYSIEAISVEKIGAGGINAGITSVEGHELDPDAIRAIGNMLQATPEIIPQSASGNKGANFDTPELDANQHYLAWAKKWKLDPTKEKNQREWANKNGVSFDSKEFDPEMFQKRVGAVAKVVKTYKENGVADFRTLATRMAERFPEKFGEMRPYLRGVWNAVAEQIGLEDVSRKQAEEIYGEIEKPQAAAPEPEPAVETPKPPPANKLPSTRISDAADEIVALIERGEKFTRKEVTDIVERQLGGKVANGDFDAKQVTDILELAVNKWVAKQSYDGKGGLFFAPDGDSGAAVDKIRALRDMLANIPTQTTRSIEQDKMQQFSTPPTEAFAATWVANVNEDDVMMEPSGGIGGIAVFSANAGAKIILNELSPRRAEILEQLGLGKPFEFNAENLYAYLEPEIKSGRVKRPTVVVMNPPFSNSQRSDKKDTHIGATHVEQALKLLAPGGRLVAIVGNGMAHGKPAFKAWWDRIGREYTVRANIGINGQEYAKYGTTFDNNIIVIDKVAPNGSIAPIYGTIQSLDELPRLLEGVRNDRPSIEKRDTDGQRPAAQQGGGGSVAQNGQDARPAGTGNIGTRTSEGASGRSRTAGRTGNRPSQSQTGVDARLGAQNNGSSGFGRSGRGGSPVGVGRDADGLDSRPDTAGGVQPALGGATDKGLAVQSVEQTREVGDGTFSEYKPSKISIPGMKPHPTALVESSAMASVQPPNPTYSPKIPKKIIEDGTLSEAQIEQVVYAGQSHEQMLASGERKGYFIGDGTGVGKGREISGIILDNFNNGRRKAVWISKTGGLANDAKRDLTPFGLADELFTMEAKNLKNLGSRSHGVAFTTYSSLAKDHERIDEHGNVISSKQGKESRMQALVKWLERDFDGVIVFDESHLAGNAVLVRGKRGFTKPSAQALAVVDLQTALPKARILYVSATGATEVNNLAYATRLGLWGKGTAFKDRDAFITQVSNGGISVMEIVARDMKAMGVYMARTLSYEGIENERITHELSPDQVKQYNLFAETWQMVMGEVENALISSNGIHGKANGNVKSAFWGAHQRFFNQTLTAMQMPSVLKKARELWEAGMSPVFQIVSTNEAAQNRALRNSKESGGDVDVENLDLSPRDILIGFVENSFPTVQYVEVDDGGDSTKWVPLTGPNGEYVHDPAAVERKERLIGRLQRMKMGEAPLDMILNEFGHENVAEVTGRSARREMVRNEDGEMEMRMVKRTKNNAKQEADEFNEGKRTVLVFSGAGNTGFSFHADRKFPNQRRRVQFMIEAGYNAAAAIQGLGRTHRANESSHPLYELCSTNLPGHKRFMSTIARRLAQLGSLTSGDRSSSGSGVFSEADNLENQYAKSAVLDLFEEMFNEDPGGFQRVCQEMGFLKARINSETGEREYVNTLINEDGKFDAADKLDIPHFLNRILAMKIDAQNELFDAFSKRMAEMVEHAKEVGTFDPGMEKLKGETVEVKNRTRLWADKDEIGTTDIVEVGVTKKSKKTDYEKAKKLLGYSAADGAVPRVYTHNASGETLMMVETNRTQTMKDGRVVSIFKQMKPDGTTGYTTETAVEKNYSQVLRDEEGVWTAAYDAVPELIEQSKYFAHGTLLPIWDRLNAQNPRFYKIVPTGGAETQAFLGMEIAPDNVENILQRFGKSVGTVEVTPDVVLNRIMKDGKKVELMNGWMLKRVKVLGDSRIEIDGVDEDADVMRLAQEPFAYSEKVGYLRVFVKPNAESLAQFLAEYPAVPDKGGLSTVTGTAEDLSGDKYKAPLRTLISRIAAASPDEATALGEEARTFMVRLSSEQLGEIFDDYIGRDTGPYSAEHAIRRIALDELQARGALDWRRRQQAESESPGGDIVNFDTPSLSDAWNDAIPGEDAYADGRLTSGRYTFYNGASLNAIGAADNGQIPLQALYAMFGAKGGHKDFLRRLFTDGDKQTEWHHIGKKANMVLFTDRDEYNMPITDVTIFAGMNYRPVSEEVLSRVIKLENDASERLGEIASRLMSENTRTELRTEQKRVVDPDIQREHQAIKSEMRRKYLAVPKEEWDSLRARRNELAAKLYHYEDTEVERTVVPSGRELNELLRNDAEAMSIIETAQREILTAFGRKKPINATLDADAAFDKVVSLVNDTRARSVQFDTPELSPAEAEYAASEDKTPTEKVMREVYGMTNDEIATALRAAGMEPPPHARKTDEDMWKQAEALLSNPSYMAKLSRAVAKFPRPIRDYENAALSVLFRERQAAVNDAQIKADAMKATLDEFNAIPKDERDAEITEEIRNTAAEYAAAKAKLAQAKALMGETGNAMMQGASEQGRALRSNRVLIDQHDMTYAGISGQIAQIVGGAERITPEMDAQIREIAKLFEGVDAQSARIATERLVPLAQKVIVQVKNGIKVRKATERKTGDEAKRVTRNYEDALNQIEVGAAEVGGTLIGMSDQQYPGWGKWLKAIGEFHCFENPNITEEECINAIVEDISPFVNADANQVRDILTGFGHNFKQSRYEAQRLMNDLKAQARLKRQMDWMNETNTMPPLTGLVRDEPSDTTRNLQKQVQERKKEVPDAGRDERRLKGVLDSAKTRVKNRIADLERAIETGEKIPASQRKVVEDIELRELKKRKDELQKAYDELFKTEHGMTDAQRIALTEKLLSKELEQALADLDRARSGDFSKRPKRPGVESPTIDVLREKITETREQIRELKKAKYEFGMTPDEIAALNARKMANREKALARLAERIATGDIRPQKKPQPPMTKDQQKQYDELGEQMKRGRQKLAELRLEAENATVPTFRRKAGEFVRFVTTAQRALRATMDFSAVLRQAARMTLAHPVKGVQAFGKSWTAARSEASLQDVNDEIMSDPLVQEAVNKFGLHLREVDATKARDVEMFHGMERNRVKMFGKEFAITDVPFFGEFMLKSERHYLTYLNAMSADLYTSIVNGIPGATAWQKKMVADMINIWNGSAALSKERRQALQKAWVNDIFWAPQLAISRVQSAVGYDWWHPLTAKGIKNAGGTFEKISAQERRTVARAGLSQHLRSTIAMLAIGALLKWLFLDDDDKYNFEQANWFEKMMMLVSPKIGNTTIDLTGGESTFDKLVHQIVTKSKRSGTGRLMKFGEFNAPTVMSAIGRYLQGKLAPSMSTLVALWEGKDFVGDAFTPGKMVQEMLMPLTFEDVKDQIQQNGVGKSLLTIPMTLLGAGGSTYDRKPYENAVNRFLEAKKEFDTIEADELLDDQNRKMLLDNIRASNPLMRDGVREDIAAYIKQIRKDESRMKKDAKLGYEVDAALFSDIEREKAQLLEKIRAVRRK